MKTQIILTFILLLISVSAMAQSSYLKSNTPFNPLEKYQKMKKSGQVLTFICPIVGIVGGVIMAESFWEYGPPDASGPYVVGEVLVVAGVALTATGITLWVRGGKKTREYQRKPEALYIRPATLSGIHGLTLSFTF
jgi:hypothetical protein